MNDNYPSGQFARAFLTASSHEDAKTRKLAEERVRQWGDVIRGVSEGTLDIGSRTPTKFPAWVSLEVVRGGYPTGNAEAGGPVEPDEKEKAQRLGLPAERGALFAYYLTDPGIAELGGLL